MELLYLYGRTKGFHKPELHMNDDFISILRYRKLLPLSGAKS